MLWLEYIYENREGGSVYEAQADEIVWLEAANILFYLTYFIMIKNEMKTLCKLQNI